MNKAKITAIMLAMAMMFTFVFGISGCSSRESAQKAVESALERIKANDFDGAGKYFGGDNVSSELSVGDDETSKHVVSKLVDNFTYKIISSKEDGDSATVTVELSNIDMSAVMGIFMSDMLSYVLSTALAPEDQQPSDKELEEKSLEFFDNALSAQYETVTKTLELPLTYADGTWTISADEEFIDGVFGGLLSYLQDVLGSFDLPQD